ncbi:MAG: hypothetical protein ACO3JL_09235, partial [Myxococcota bacterium]
ARGATEIKAVDNLQAGLKPGAPAAGQKPDDELELARAVLSQARQVLDASAKGPSAAEGTKP